MRGAITERQRQDYLAAMGIQPWFPRFKLPNARPSQVCEWQWEESDFPDQPVSEAALQSSTDLPAHHSPQLHAPSISHRGHTTAKAAPSAGPAPKESSDILVDLGPTKEELS